MSALRLMAAFHYAAQLIGKVTAGLAEFVANFARPLSTKRKTTASMPAYKRYHRLQQHVSLEFRG